MSEITEVTLALFGKQSGHNRREGDKLYEGAFVSYLYPLRARQDIKIESNYIGGGKFLGNVKTPVPVQTDISLEGTIRQVLFEITEQPTDVSTLNASASFELAHQGTVEHDITVSDLGQLSSTASFTMSHAVISFVNVSRSDIGTLSVNATMNLLVE